MFKPHDPLALIEHLRNAPGVGAVDEAEFVMARADLDRQRAEWRDAGVTDDEMIVLTMIVTKRLVANITQASELFADIDAICVASTGLSYTDLLSAAITLRVLSDARR